MARPQPLHTDAPAGFFYGWLVLGAACLVMFLGTGTMFSFGVFLKPIQLAFGWPRAAVSATFAINWLVLGASSFVFGALSDRSTRLVVAIGGVAFGLGLLLAARVTALWQLYLTFGVLPGVATGAFYVPLVSLATRWFTARRGLAVGIVSGGAGLGMVVIPRLANGLMETYGLSPTLMILGLLGIAVILPLTWLIRNSPAAMGLRPYGEQPDASLRRNAQEASPEASSGDWRYLLTFPFPLIALTHLLCCIAHSGPQYHMIALMTDSGFARATAAAVFSAWALAGVGGRLLTGVIADRYGVQRTLVLMLTAQALTIVLYVLAGSLATFYLFGVLFGTIYGAVMPLYALLIRTYYPEHIVGKVYGGVFCIAALGMGSGSFLGGLVFDLLGSYTFLFVISAAVGSVAFLTAVALPASTPQPLRMAAE
jgi:MFS family permease